MLCEYLEGSKWSVNLPMHSPEITLWSLPHKQIAEFVTRFSRYFRTLSPLIFVLVLCGWKLHDCQHEAMFMGNCFPNEALWIFGSYKDVAEPWLHVRLGGLGSPYLVISNLRWFAPSPPLPLPLMPPLPLLIQFHNLMAILCRHLPLQCRYSKTCSISSRFCELW